MGVIRGLLDWLSNKGSQPEVIDLRTGENAIPAVVVDPSGGLIRGARRVYQPRPGYITLAKAEIIAGVPAIPTLLEMCRSQKLASYQISFEDDTSWCVLESEAKKIKEARTSQASVHPKPSTGRVISNPQLEDAVAAGNPFKNTTDSGGDVVIVEETPPLPSPWGTRGR